jgi:hypothetical protein
MHLTALRPQSLAAALRLAPPQPAHATSYAQARAKRSGGPEDRALYTCECGYAFKASVTTTVSCPHCRQTQAW